MADPKVTREHRSRVFCAHYRIPRDQLPSWEPWRSWLDTGDIARPDGSDIYSELERTAQALATLEAEALERGRREEREAILHADWGQCELWKNIRLSIERGDHLKGGESG